MLWCWKKHLSFNSLKLVFSLISQLDCLPSLGQVHFYPTPMHHSCLAWKQYFSSCKVEDTGQFSWLLRTVLICVIESAVPEVFGPWHSPSGLKFPEASNISVLACHFCFHYRPQFFHMKVAYCCKLTKPFLNYYIFYHFPMEGSIQETFMRVN